VSLLISCALCIAHAQTATVIPANEAASVLCELRYSGHSGSGFGERGLADALDRLKPLFVVNQRSQRPQLRNPRRSNRISAPSNDRGARHGDAQPFQAVYRFRDAALMTEKKDDFGGALQNLYRELERAEELVGPPG